MATHRILSLLASSTEIVCALNCGGQLVGRSHECDYPSWVRQLPACSAPKLDPTGPSGSIDRQVKSLLQDGLSIYRLDLDKIRELQPDIIITQSHCEVCAVSAKDVEHALGDWLGTRPRVISLTPNGLGDVFTGISQIALALDVPEAGKELAHRLLGCFISISRKSTNLTSRPTVVGIEWMDPLMAIGNWTPYLVMFAGGWELLGEFDQHSPQITWEQLLLKDPDVLLVMPCGFDLAQTRRDLPVLTQNPRWPKLRAVQTGRVYLCDGNQYFNRPGPRLVESLEILAEILHPEKFAFGHEGKGWERVPHGRSPG